MHYKLLRCAILAAAAAALALPASAGDLKLSMQNGRVTILAEDVPLRTILDEWARVGHTTIVNAEKLNGPAMTLQLVDTPEREALDILLRSASGYIAAPRRCRWPTRRSSIASRSWRPAAPPAFVAGTPPRRPSSGRRWRCPPTTATSRST